MNKCVDVLIQHFSDMLKKQGAKEPESIIYAANFVSELSKEQIEKELKYVTIH